MMLSREAIAKRGKPPGHDTIHQEIVKLRQSSGRPA
jgi:hypothetical protein